MQASFTVCRESQINLISGYMNLNLTESVLLEYPLLSLLPFVIVYSI